MITSSPLDSAIVAPAHLYRGHGILKTVPLEGLGERILVIGGEHSLERVRAQLTETLDRQGSQQIRWTTYGVDCSERELARLRLESDTHATTGIIGVGGGKALDTAKLVAQQLQVPILTVPTSAATCAAWSALSNVYTDQGAFHHDVPLQRAPEAVIIDYDLIRSAPVRTLRAGVGDALAKWYEASVSSGASEDALVIGAVQQARVLRDLLLQRSERALAEPGGSEWRQVVDACICLAGVVGGLGGAQCRTVAAHAVHNGLTHLLGHRGSLHGEKVAFGILVQQRLEEILQGNQLAAAARRQLLEFYGRIGLPRTLGDLGLGSLTSADLRRVAEVACHPRSDIHHLPFPVMPEALVVALQTPGVDSATGYGIGDRLNEITCSLIDQT